MESELKLIQPYFVIQTSGFYQEVYQKHGISHFYTFQLENSKAEVMTVPDGCVDVIFTYGEGGMDADICGTVLCQKSLFMRSKKEYFGIRFLPGVMPAGLGVQMKELVERQIDMRELPQTGELIMRMEEQTTFEQRISTFLSEYAKAYGRQMKKMAVKQILDTINQVIYKTNGKIKIKELEEYTGYTARYLNKVFTAEMGVSPKTFCKIIQFQKTLDYLNQAKEIRLTDVALDFGYYDQAQLVHDFKQFTSATPREYKRLLVEKEYQKHIVETEYLMK